MFKKKVSLKPAQILKLSVFCSKKSQVKIIQQTDGEDLDSVQKEKKLIEFIQQQKGWRRLRLCSKK